MNVCAINTMNDCMNHKPTCDWALDQICVPQKGNTHTHTSTTHTHARARTHTCTRARTMLPAAVCAVALQRAAGPSVRCQARAPVCARCATTRTHERAPTHAPTWTPTRGVLSHAHARAWSICTRWVLQARARASGPEAVERCSSTTRRASSVCPCTPARI